MKIHAIAVVNAQSSKTRLSTIRCGSASSTRKKTVSRLRDEVGGASTSEAG
jgi:hypothetical protein